MMELIAVVVALWLLGIIGIPFLSRPHFPTLHLGGMSITIETIIVVLILVWIASSVGGPIRQIIWVLVVLWILSALGIVVIGGLSNLLVIGILIGLVLTLVQGNKK